MNQEESAEIVKEAIRKKLALAADSPAHAVISERHRTLLVQAYEEAKEARVLLNQHVEQQAALGDHLRSALEHVGQVTGRTYHEELLDNIFPILYWEIVYRLPFSGCALRTIGFAFKGS